MPLLILHYGRPTAVIEMLPNNGLLKGLPNPRLTRKQYEARVQLEEQTLQERLNLGDGFTITTASAGEAMLLRTAGPPHQPPLTLADLEQPITAAPPRDTRNLYAVCDGAVLSTATLRLGKLEVEVALVFATKGEAMEALQGVLRLSERHDPAVFGTAATMAVRELTADLGRTAARVEPRVVEVGRPGGT